MADRDHSYKLLFAHPQLVRDLLEGFVCGDWLREVDFNTLERVSSNYVSDDLRNRAGDIVWRVRCGDHQVYLLVEFQSSVEPFMAVRVLTYVGLLYQDLIRAKQISSDGLLPRVLPIVLHSGSSPWRAAEEIASLLRNEPGELQRYGPTLRYVLIDESSYEDVELAGRRNLVAMLFRLENCRRDQIAQLVQMLESCLRGPDDESLRRAFAVWVDRVILARLSSDRVNPHGDLWERRAMLSENFDRWEEELRQEGELKLLMRQLRKRFGDLPDALRARLTAARRDEIELWGERLLDAGSLNDLFNEAQAT